MLNWLFGKTKCVEIDSTDSDLEFLADIDGDGVDAVRFEIAKILKGFSYVENAYFSKIQYKNEDKTRVALVIQSAKPSNSIGHKVASKCAGVIPMDVCFSDNISSQMFSKIKSHSIPLFCKSNLLFECPLVLTRGTNQEMPAEWKGAILNYYVAASDYESALSRALNDVKTEGYDFVKVHDDKVNQLDPSTWWKDYVMEKWPDYSEHFPTQEDMEIIVLTGGLHKGPLLGWETESQDV